MLEDSGSHYASLPLAIAAQYYTTRVSGKDREPLAKLHKDVVKHVFFIAQLCLPQTCLEKPLRFELL